MKALLPGAAFRSGFVPACAAWLVLYALFSGCLNPLPEDFPSENAPETATPVAETEAGGQGPGSPGEDTLTDPNDLAEPARPDEPPAPVNPDAGAPDAAIPEAPDAAAPDGAAADASPPG